MTVKVAIQHVDGGYSEDDYEIGILAKHDKLVQQGLSGKDLIKQLISDDWAAPPRKVTLSFWADGRLQDIELFYS